MIMYYIMVPLNYIDYSYVMVSTDSFVRR